MKFSLREISLYRFRHILGFTLFGVALLGLLSVELGSLPAGLAEQEILSVTRSVTLNILNSPPEAVINAPYHMLQKVSVWLFGLTPLAIKLPSILLAALLAFSMVGVLRRFFRLSATSITALLMISSLPFLVMGRTGAPLIMLSLLSAVLLITSAFVLARTKRILVWKALAAVVAVSLLYTPLGVYPLIAFIVAAVLHPHLRYHLTHTKPVSWGLVAGAALIACLPLLVAAIRQPDILLTLSGIPASFPGWSVLGANLAELVSMLFGLIEPQFDFIARPLFGLPLLILMLFGLLQLIKDRHSARTYVLLGWLGVFLIILSFNTAHVLNIFVPAVLLLAIGIEALLREWYSLFPKNPYARIAALVPLTILVFGIASIETARYFDGYRYATSLESSAFQPHLTPLRQALSSPPLKDADRIFLVVPSDKTAFYDLLRREYGNLTVTTEPQSLAANQFNVVLATAKVDPETELGRIVDFETNTDRTNNLLFTVYRPAQP